MASRRNCARLAVSQKPSSSQARLRPTKPGLLTVGWRKLEFQTRVPAGAAFRKNGPLVNAPFTAFILRTRANRANRDARRSDSQHPSDAARELQIRRRSTRGYLRVQQQTARELTTAP